MVHTCHSTLRRQWQEDQGVQGCLWLHREFEASLGNMGDLSQSKPHSPVSGLFSCLVSIRPYREASELYLVLTWNPSTEEAKAGGLP